MLVGDGLGVPYEFKRREEIPALELIEMDPSTGFRRSHPGVPPGTWSDDGAQGLCLLDSLLHCGELDLKDFGARLLRWLDSGYLAPDSSVFDCGIQTKQALTRLREGTPAARSGGRDERDNGNGSLMRTLPLALWHRGDNRQLVLDAHNQSQVTHGHPRSQVACALYCLWARQLLYHGDNDGWNAAVTRLEEIYREERPGIHDAGAFLGELNSILKYENASAPQGSGYVVDTLWSARHALESGDYAAVVRAAIRLGNDTDTTACVAGGLAGIRGGLEGIPERWRSKLRGKELYAPLLERLSARISDLYNPPRRVMEMVAVLLEMGYQKLRFLPFIGPAGAWRFMIAVEDPWKRRSSEKTVYQSPGWGNQGLGWGDEPWDDPQRLATKFLLKFPRIAELGHGYDFEYASWYREALRKTPPGKSFALSWDGEEPTGQVLIENPGGNQEIPFPPGWNQRT